MGLAPWVEGESSKAMADLSKYDIIFGVCVCKGRVVWD